MKNYLTGKKSYLCGGMFSHDDCGVSWRDSITPKLQEMGIIVSDPTKITLNGLSEVGADKQKFRDLILGEKWGELKETFWPIIRKDLRLVDHSDFLIFYYDPAIPTVGTWREVSLASSQKKPILMKYDKEHLNKFNPWVCEYIKTTHFFSNWDSLLNHLKVIDNGVFDTSYWTI